MVIALDQNRPLRRLEERAVSAITDLHVVEALKRHVHAPAQDRHEPVSIKDMERVAGREFTTQEVMGILTANGVSGRSVKVNVRGKDVETFYLEAGDIKNPTVVLIHGGGNCSAMNWRYQILGLAEHFHVIVPDRPGYGLHIPNHGTPKPDGHKGVLDYYVNDFVGQFMDAVNVYKASVVGNSEGGGIATGFALSHPERVERLVLIAPTNISEVKIPLAVKVAGAIAPLSVTKKLVNRLSDNDEVIRWILSAINRNKEKSHGPQDPPQIPEPASERTKSVVKEFMSEGGFTNAFWEYLKDQFANPRTLFSQLLKTRHISPGFSTVYDLAGLHETPVLVFGGSSDLLFNTDSIRHSVEHSQNGKYIEMKGHGHGPQYESPEMVTSEISQFLLEGREQARSAPTRKKRIIDALRHAA